MLKKLRKITLVLALVIVMLTPYTSVFAKLKHSDTTATIRGLLLHEGGREESGSLIPEQEAVYDTKPYMYTVGDLPTVIKISNNGNYEDSFYCLDYTKSLPETIGDKVANLEYKNVGDFYDSTNQTIKSLHLGTSYATDSAKWTENYRALSWLYKNCYLEKNTPEQKLEFLDKVFENSTYEKEVILAYLTDDDIDVVQQCAIWYFTNGDSEKANNTELPAIQLEDVMGNKTSLSGERYMFAKYLYNYLITNAKNPPEEVEVVPPTIANTNTEITENDNFIIVGPFKVQSGNLSKSACSIKLLDQNDRELQSDEYKVYIEGENDFSAGNVSDIYDKNYYIYLPKNSEEITALNLVLGYSVYETNASVWKNNTTNSSNEEVYQPVVLLTRTAVPYSNNKKVNIVRPTNPDLALRKYIVKVNDNIVVGNRNPVVDVTPLKAGQNNAIYKHAKSPCVITNGDKVVFEIRVYNEGDVEANGPVIVDFLPEGMELAQNSSINETYGWKLDERENNDNRYYISEYLVNQKINGFDIVNGTTLDSKYVQIECVISENAKPSAVLTNIAEIRQDSIDDRDSAPSSNDYINNKTDATNYTGDKNNKSDLSDSSYFYKGYEDDDDFEKVQVAGKTFDLSLKKFITGINNKKVAGREPQVDVTPLKQGKSNATYTMAKNSLTVKQGDIITYTIRVYNEGELAGYAEEVSDFLPEGLGYLVYHKTNIDNFWKIPENSTTVKLSTIPNAVNNLSKDDFNNVDKLEDTEVVKGKVKLYSTKLASNITTGESLNTRNLLQPFNKKTGTELDYKDIEIACVVLDAEVAANNFKNIAEVQLDKDEEGNDVIDIDSDPDTVNPDNYPGEDVNQDDHDFENLTIETPEPVPQDFDLSLKKFITGVNDKKIEGRAPEVSPDTSGKVQFTSGKAAQEALQVENNDVIIYTIRVYNEGEVDGYAKEVSDDLPAGIEFLKDNELNKKYGWKLYDKNGKETSDIKQAVSVKTNYLSKEVSTARKDNALIKAFDGKTVYYKDVQIAFKVTESAVNKTIKNIAEITDDEDKDGNSVEDIDSTPGNNKTGEDDIDDEKIFVKYFDLALKKDLVKIIITEDGQTREIAVNSADGLQKVEIHRKKIDSTIVKFVYNITVTNEGQIAGYATEITDYIPQGLQFVAEDNSGWTKKSEDVVTTNALEKTLLEPGKSASVQITLKWINGENNLNLKINTAEISKDKNNSNTPDIDSKPGNKNPNEDDIDNAKVFLAISTGTAPTYIALTTVVLAIMVTGIALIKKYVLI